jgi:hypothetical protein
LKKLVLLITTNQVSEIETNNLMMTFITEYRMALREFRTDIYEAETSDNYLTKDGFKEKNRIVIFQELFETQAYLY